MVKKLIFILSLFVSLAAGAFVKETHIPLSKLPATIHATTKEAKDTIIVLTVGKPGYAALVNSTVIDDGYYNGFPFPFQIDNTIYTIYKKSGDHSSAGPMTLAKSTNGGSSWTESQIRVDGFPINCAALSVGVYYGTSGTDPPRIIIGYQDNTSYTSLKFAYSDDLGATFTGSATVLTNGTGLSFSPVKMRILPSGKILCGYYTGYGSGENASIGFVTSTNGGSTWSFGPTIFTHAGTGFGDNKGFEFGFEIVDNTGSDATCKLIALVRDADVGAVYMHYKSTDGGATWTTDLVNSDNPGAYSRHYLYNFGSYTSAAPCDIFVHNGLVYVLTGYRNTGAGQDYALEYITASVTDALTNNYYNWSTVTVVLTTGQNDVNFGYSLMFHDWDGKLWCHYYDMSPLSNNGLGIPRELIKQQKIAD